MLLLPWISLLLGQTLKRLRNFKYVSACHYTDVYGSMCARSPADRDRIERAAGFCDGLASSPGMID
jgi:hypothetical protein